MDQFEREDSSTYVEPGQTQPAEPAREEPVRPPAYETPKPKKSKTPLVLTLLLLLALAVAATFGWMWYQQNGRVDNLEADLSKARNDVSRLESAAKAEDSLADDTSVTTDTKNSDSEEVIKAALAEAAAPSVKDSKLKAEVAYVDEAFARVNISTSGAGYYQVLKKSNGIWVVIASGNGELSQEVIDRFGIPKAALDS